jgi:D-alanyl-D-alanine carboxypeptidase/D-alanyl-D-alanine-endopeptidase (penicillin-binding protein 4)
MPVTARRRTHWPRPAFLSAVPREFPRALSRFRRRCLFSFSLLAAGAAGAAPAASPALPTTVQNALAQARVAAAGSAFVVVPLDGGTLNIAVHDDAPMNPASTMKLLTTYVALATLGPNYRWHTAVFASRSPSGGRLDGDLIVRGDGDPSLVIERWWLLIQRLRGLGIKDIRGNLVLDRSRYAPAVEAGPTLDGNELRPYNVAPDALLINFKALSLDFIPDTAAGVARIVPTPALDGVSLPAHVPLGHGACGDWKAQLKADFSHARAPRFAGSYPRACGNRTWHVSLLSPDEYALATFRTLWRAAGGAFHGSVRAGRVGADAVPLLEQESPPLADVIRDINKNSNNVMARQLFLTLGIADADEEGAPAASDEPASAERSARAVRAWLDREGLSMPELELQNGSGLSRDERISAASLARLLVAAWHGNDMPGFLASLPLAGVDGTMKNRHAAVHAAYVKTGYLADVRAVAGYVFAASGHRYAVVALINDPHADAAQAAHDEFLQWVWKEG